MKEDLNTILEKISKRSGVSVKKIKSDDRHHHVVEARRLFCYVCKKYTKFTLEAIGEAINCDHATVHYHYKKVTDLMDTERDYRNEITTLTADLQLQVDARTLQLLEEQRQDALEVLEYLDNKIKITKLKLEII